MPPAEFSTSLGGVAEENIDLGRSEVTLVDFDEHAPARLVDPLLGGSLSRPSDPMSGPFEGALHELAHRIGFSSRQNEVVGLILLQDHPHALSIVACVAPVTLGVEVAEIEPVLQAEMDCCDRPADFARDEGLAADRAFMVEQIPFEAYIP